MRRPPDLYRAADHEAKQRSEKQKTDFLLANCEAWLMKRAATAEEAKEHQGRWMYWTRKFLDGDKPEASPGLSLVKPGTNPEDGEAA